MGKITVKKSTAGRIAAAGAFAGLLLASTAALAQEAKEHFTEFEAKELLPETGPSDLSKSAPVSSAGSFVLGFEGISQYDAASFARNFIPPDTMGAVGTTQYMEVSNGAYAVYDKYTGSQLSLTSDLTFWSSKAGLTGANGDSRVMFNAAANRWIVLSFAASVANIQIAVSDTADALGSWKSTTFTGFSGGTADYPTLALDTNAVYIGTNNFKSGCNAGTTFCGTTLNVIPLDSLFNATTPTTANMKSFVTNYSDTPGAVNVDRGFAIQGVNSVTAGSSGSIVAASLFIEDSLAYKISGLTSSSAAGSFLGAQHYLGESAFTTPEAARQPNAINPQVIDAGDERIGSSVYEANGRIYMVHTESQGPGTDDKVHYVVMNATTYAILDEGDIGTAGYDTYQGSIAVNALGEVVIGYNRSGPSVIDGKIRFYAQSFQTDATGHLISTSSPILLKESLTDDYHNGAAFGGVATGRQRWGDYSQVSVDPTDAHGFYLIGQFAREYNNAAGGHPGGSGASRWGTFIARISTAAVAAVPETDTWAMMIAGFGIIGASMRRRRARITAVTFG